MSEHELEAVELTNMCAIVNPQTDEVLVQRRVKSWTGISFPGGHVERGEALVSSTIREIKEETGLSVDHLRFCGVKDWYEPDKDKRYMVFLFTTTDYSGQLLAGTDEGEVYWEKISRLPQLELSSGFAEMAAMMLSGGFAEFWYDISSASGEWVKKFY